MVRESRSRTIRLPGVKNGSATRKRPRLSTVATIPSAGPARALARVLRERRLRRRGGLRFGDRPGAGSQLVGETSSARSSASSRFVSGSSLARTSGLSPWPGLRPAPPRLRPLGRKYWPTVRSSAPPLSSGMISWKTPLPNVRDADELGALAVLQRAGDDLRRRRGAGVDEHDRRELPAIGWPTALSVCVGTARPRVVTIGPSAMNMLAISCACVTSRRRCRAGRARSPSRRGASRAGSRR